MSKPGSSIDLDGGSGDPGRVRSLARPGRDSFESALFSFKGGDTVFLNTDIDIQKDGLNTKTGERNKKILMDDYDNKPLLLIRSAELAKKEGNIRSSSPMPSAAEQLGIAINILRRKQSRSIHWVSRATGYSPEELIAFEAGVLTNKTMLAMLPDITNALRLNQSQLQQVQINLVTAT